MHCKLYISRTKCDFKVVMYVRKHESVSLSWYKKMKQGEKRHTYIDIHKHTHAHTSKESLLLILFPNRDGHASVASFSFTTKKAYFLSFFCYWRLNIYYFHNKKVLFEKPEKITGSVLKDLMRFSSFKKLRMLNYKYTEMSMM